MGRAIFKIFWEKGEIEFWENFPKNFQKIFQKINIKKSEGIVELDTFNWKEKEKKEKEKTSTLNVYVK